jgi:hypothetical protein
MTRTIEGRVLLAGAAFAAAVLLFGTTLVGAVRSGDPAPVPAPPRPVIIDSAGTAGEVITMQAVNEAVAIDPFNEERTPPAEPYRLPGDPVEEPAPPPPPAPPPIPSFRLVGTTQTPSGGIALIQLADAQPQVVAVGETLNGYVVERIDRTTAVMSQGDRRVELQLQQPLLRVTAPTGRRGAGPQRGRGTPAQETARRQETMREMEEVMLRQAAQQRIREAAARQNRDTLSQPNLRNDR